MVLEEHIGKHPKACFTYQDQPIRRSNCNTAWYKALAESELEDFCFHDLRHTWLPGIVRQALAVMNSKIWAAVKRDRW